MIHANPQAVWLEELMGSWLAKAKARLHRGYVAVRERRKGWWSRHLTWLSFPIGNVGTVSYPSHRAAVSIKCDTAQNALPCVCWLDQQMPPLPFAGYLSLDEVFPDRTAHGHLSCLRTPLCDTVCIAVCVCVSKHTYYEIDDFDHYF